MLWLIGELYDFFYGFLAKHFDEFFRQSIKQIRLGFIDYFSRDAINMTQLTARECTLSDCVGNENEYGRPDTLP